MIILNPTVREDIKAGRPLRLNLGAGMRRLSGYYNVDCVPLDGIDVLANLEEPLSELPTGCVEAIYCRHTLEHVGKFLELLGEIHRICRANAQIDVIVPHFSNPYGYSDPTHVRFFGVYSFNYFADDPDQPSRRKVPNFYIPQRFRVEKVRVNLMRESWVDKTIRALLQPLVNYGPSWQDWYERRICRFFPADDIHYRLRPVESQSAALKLAG
jgi:hypothetical protein